MFKTLKKKLNQLFKFLKDLLKTVTWTDTRVQKIFYAFE